MKDKSDGPKIKGPEMIILLSIVMGTFMTALDATIVSVALPSMAESFGVEGGGHSTGAISWVLLGYTLMLCCFILLWGKLGSNIGYKKVFLTGVFIFTITSLGIGLVGTFFSDLGLNTIIALRMIQGLGAGMVMAMGMALVSSYFGKGVRGVALSFVTLAASAGTAFGPALGGVLTEFDWSYIFFINVPIGIICIIMSMRSMKKVEAIPEKKKLDYAGVAILFVMMFAFIYYLNKGGDIGWLSTTGIALIVVTIVAAFLIYWRENHTNDPIVKLSLVSERSILSANMSALMIFGAMAGSYLLLPYYLTIIGGYSTVEMGLILIANSIGIMVSGPIVGKLSDKNGKNKRFVMLGCLVGAVGFGMMYFFGMDTGLPYIIASLFVMGIGVGMTLVAGTNLAFSHSDDADSGSMSGLVNTFRQAGGSVGVALLSSVFMASLGTVLVKADLIPGFSTAFVVAVVLSLAGMVISMFAKDGEHRTEEKAVA